MKINHIFLLVLMAAVAACTSDQKPSSREVVTDQEKPGLHILRYDQALFGLKEENLQAGLKAMQKDYAFFLSTNLEDTANLNQIRTYLSDPRNKEFYKEVMKKYANLSDLENELETAFENIGKEFPGWKAPKVYAYLSGGMYENPVIYADSVLLIALDLYLGKGFLPYHRDLVPQYRMSRMTPGSIAPDVVDVIATSLLRKTQVRPSTLLDNMILEGKKLCLMDVALPDAAENIKIGYPGPKMEWARANEAQVWAAIIGNKLLYTRNGEMISKFIVDGPFTSGFPQESPSRLGVYIGWKIDKAYLENNSSVTLANLFSEKDSQKILAQSGFKPER